MHLKTVVENNVTVILCGVAVASGMLVFGVVDFFHHKALESLKSEHRIALVAANNALETSEERLAATIETLSAEKEHNDTCHLVKNFTSLHSRILTYAHTRPFCDVFSSAFGDALSGIDWDIREMYQDYGNIIARMEDVRIAHRRISRAGPSYLAISGHGAWPIANMAACLR